jgi:hypothetical protein
MRTPLANWKVSSSVTLVTRVTRVTDDGMAAVSREAAAAARARVVHPVLVTPTPLTRTALIRQRGRPMRSVLRRGSAIPNDDSDVRAADPTRAASLSTVAIDSHLRCGQSGSAGSAGHVLRVVERQTWSRPAARETIAAALISPPAWRRAPRGRFASNQRLAPVLR